MAEVREVAVPDIGDFSEVPVIEILVSPGDHVNAEDTLLTLESDKAAMELPSPEAGVIKELRVGVGDKVSEGTIVVVLEPGDGAAESSSSPEESKGAEAASAGADSGAGKDGMKPEAASSRTIDAASSAEESAAVGKPAAQGSGSDNGGRPGAGDGEVYASPSVRKRAREIGADLASVQGTGRKGRITLEDLEQTGSSGGGSASRQSGTTTREPLTRIQKLSAQNLSKAWQTIPHVTQHELADITDLEALRKQLNNEQKDVKVTMVALLLKVCALALDEYPRFASSLDGEEVVVKHDRHIGFAADTPQGLVVPVIRDVDRKGVLEIAGELTELSAKARAGKLGMGDMSGAVFTISSLGGIGGTAFTPIVNPPQVAILGVSRSSQQPQWDGSQFMPRLMLPLSLSYDHRVIDGALAARFCVYLRQLLEDMRRAVL